ncbi:MAG: AIR carboxylase family protein [Bacillus subtilis]|nr:AIR carboxylase family protein [Bacillus subtilis]
MSLEQLPGAVYLMERARIISYGEFPEPTSKNYALVITAGTADMPVAQAIITLKTAGIKTETLFDCGVAGSHRLLNHADKILKANVIIAVAGMEGAVASVIGGIASCPVIAVPTSVGYGASFWRNSRVIEHAKQLRFKCQRCKY